MFHQEIQIQCPPLNRISLGRHKSDNNNRMIQLTDVFCALHLGQRYLITNQQFSMIPLSVGHCSDGHRQRDILGTETHITIQIQQR
jgi:hypothetical protein